MTGDRPESLAHAREPKRRSRPIGQAIEISREVWTSPDLMLTVCSRDFDPRSGAVSYQPKNLKRVEPEATLVRVPADFRRPRPMADAAAAAISSRAQAALKPGC